MHSGDFRSSELFAFEGECRLWNREKVICTLDFPAADLERRQAVLNKRLPFIKEQLAWLENSRAAIEQALLDDGMAALAERWAESAEEAEDEETACYIMEDGLKVFLPITPEVFCRSLYASSVSLVFDGGWDNPYISLGLGCSPDYFAGHVISVSVDAQKQVHCDGLTG